MIINKQLRKSISCVFSLLLAFVMIACLFPNSVLAQGGTADSPAETSDVQIEKTSGAINYYEWSGEEGAFKTTPTQDFVTTNKSGAITASKTITGTSTENKFDIELKVTTTQPVISSSASPDSAVVLVIDVSSSMYRCSTCGKYASASNGNENCTCGGTFVSRLDATKIAAEKFITGFANTDNATGAKRYMSLVTFNGTATQVQGWIDVAEGENAKSLTDIIKVLTASNSTNVAGGLASADQFLSQLSGATANDHTALTREQAFVLLLGDGEPLSVTGVEPPDGYPAAEGDENYTYAEAWSKKIRDEGTQILAAYAGTNENDKGYKWFSKISDKLALCSNVADLERTFNEYLIWIRLANKAWVVNDPMGDNITYALEEGHDYKLSFDGTNGFKWHLNAQIPSYFNVIAADGSVISENIAYEKIEDPTYEDEEIRLTFIMKYSIYLDPVGANAASYGLTNDHTTLTYYLINDENQPVPVNEAGDPIHDGEDIIIENDVTYYPMPQISFNVPKVKALAANLTFKKIDDAGKPLAGAEFTITSTLAQGISAFTKTETSGDGGLVTFSSLPSGVSYTLTETKAPANYVATSLTPGVNVAWGKVSVSGVDEANKLTPSKEGDPLFTVVNVADPETEKITISGKKTWVNADAPEDVTLTIQLYADGVAVGGATATACVDTKWKFEFTGLSAYKQGETAGGYKEIVYSVREMNSTTPVEPGNRLTLNGVQYTVAYDGNAKDGFAISNTLYTAPVYLYELETIYTTTDSSGIGTSEEVSRGKRSEAAAYTVTINPAEYKSYDGDDYDYVATGSHLSIGDAQDQSTAFTDNASTTVDVNQSDTLYKVVLNYHRTLDTPADIKVTVNYYESGTNRVLRTAYVKSIENGTYDVSAQKLASLQYNGSTYNFSSQSGDLLKAEGVATDQVINLYYTKASNPVYPDWDSEPTPTPTPTQPEWITSPQTGESAQNWSFIASLLALGAVAVLTVKRKTQD